MYSKLIDTFLTVADCGSLTKAAEKLHISSPAVIKQINQLEDDVGTPLFYRTSKGVSLTEAGKSFWEESRKLIRVSEEALRRVRQVGARSTQQVRMGTALLHSARYFLHLWSSVYGKPLEHRVNIIPFLDNTFEQYMDVVNNLGKEIDVIAAVYPQELSGYHCNATEITKMPFACAVPSGHRLVDRQLLEVSDFRGESLIILERGLDPNVDEARTELEKYSDINLISTSHYEPATFNRCEATNQLLLSRECWQYAHPMLKTIPINWSYGGSYGLLYAKEPSKDTRLFIEFIERSLKKGHK